MTQMPGRLDPRQFSLCCLTVLAALLPHATWLPAPFMILLLALIGARWLQRARWPRPWPWWFRTGLMLALFAAAWTSIGTISGSQGAGFLAAMLVSKLYEAERARDARAVATFASFLVMAQFLVQNQLWAMLAGLPGVVLALATLASLHQAPAAAKTPVLRPLRQSAVLLAIGLPFALLMFVLLPRLNAPLWGNTFANTRGGMGLSDRMDPGQFGGIALDDRPALRVRFPDGVPNNALRYFRGLTLWLTDGRSWSRPEWAQLPQTELPPVPDRGIRHEITLEADAAPWLPALDRPIAAPAGLRLAVDHSLPLPRRNRALRYEAVSDPSLLLEPFELGQQTRSLALQLPQARNPRTRALAARLRAEHPDDEAFARRLLLLFREGDYAYSLEPPPLGSHAVDEFLFDTLSGYCEHYASAYATLLRAGGVPARVVLGYQGGYFNAVGGYLIVRRADAHAWVEAWLPGRGWMRADPTAMVAPERIDSGSDALAEFEQGFRRSGIGRWLRDRWDFLELRWTDWVVNYRAADQTALLDRLLDWLPRIPMLLAAIVVAIVVAWLLAFGWLRRGRPRARTADDPLARWYRRFRAVLRGAGVPSTPAEPVSIVAARASTAYPAQAAEFAAITQRYQAARYAAGTDGDEPSGTALAKLWLKLRWARLRRSRPHGRRP